MLTRCTKTYSSSCLQIVLVYLQPFHRNSLLKCALPPVEIVCLPLKGTPSEFMEKLYKSWN